eukprot:GEMP01000481.1.p1 GENE.GEMP01000481.1~~GEMP01000481.1.p1  ORF type:complete len:2057 (+),score=417.57 GEMP01000481.1:235-6405(+)
MWCVCFAAFFAARAELEKTKTTPEDFPFSEFDTYHIGLTAFSSTSLVVAFSSGGNNGFGMLVETSITDGGATYEFANGIVFNAEPTRYCRIAATPTTTNNSTDPSERHFVLAWVNGVDLQGKYVFSQLPLSHDIEDYNRVTFPFETAGEVNYLEVIVLENANEVDVENEYSLLAYGFRTDREYIGRFRVASKQHVISQPISFFPYGIGSLAVAAHGAQILVAFSFAGEGYAIKVRSCYWDVSVWSEVSCDDDLLTAYSTFGSDLSLTFMGPNYFIVLLSDYGNLNPTTVAEINPRGVAVLGMRTPRTQSNDTMSTNDTDTEVDTPWRIGNTVDVFDGGIYSMALQPLGPDYAAVVYSLTIGSDTSDGFAVLIRLSEGVLYSAGVSNAARTVFNDGGSRYIRTVQLDSYSYAVAYRDMLEQFKGMILTLGFGFKLQPRMDADPTDNTVVLHGMLHGSQRVLCVPHLPPGDLSTISDDMWVAAVAANVFRYAINSLAEWTTYNAYCITDDGVLSDPVEFKTKRSCREPTGILHAKENGTCQMAIIPWGSACAPQCIPPTYPNLQHLYCSRGSLFPPFFQCIDKTSPRIVGRVPVASVKLHHPSDVIVLTFDEGLQKKGSGVLEIIGSDGNRATAEWEIGGDSFNVATFYLSKLKPACNYTFIIPDNVLADRYDLQIVSGTSKTRGELQGIKPNYFRRAELPFTTWPRESCTNKVDDDDDGDVDCDDLSCFYHATCLPVCTECDVRQCGPDGVVTLNVTYVNGSFAASELQLGAQGAERYVFYGIDRNSFSAKQGLHGEYAIRYINGQPIPLGNISAMLVEFDGAVDLTFVWAWGDTCAKCFAERTCECRSTRAVSLSCPNIKISFLIPNLDYELLMPAALENSEKWQVADSAKNSLFAALKNEFGMTMKLPEKKILVTIKPGSTQVLVTIICSSIEHMEQVYNATLAFSAAEWNARLLHRVQDALVPAHFQNQILIVMDYHALMADVFAPHWNASETIVIGQSAPLRLHWNEEVVMAADAAMRIDFDTLESEFMLAELSSDVMDALNGTSVVHWDVDGTPLLRGDVLDVSGPPAIFRRFSSIVPFLSFPKASDDTMDNATRLLLGEDDVDMISSDVFHVIVPRLPEGGPEMAFEIEAGVVSDRFGNYNFWLNGTFRIGRACDSSCGSIEHGETCDTTCPPLSASFPDPGICDDGEFVQDCLAHCATNELSAALNMSHYIAPGHLPLASHVPHGLRLIAECDEVYLRRVTWISVSAQTLECANGTWEIPVCGPENCNEFSLGYASDGNGYAPLDERSVRCDENAVIIAGVVPSIMVCVNGTWVGTLPVCAPCLAWEKPDADQHECLFRCPGGIWTSDENEEDSCSLCPEGLVPNGPTSCGPCPRDFVQNENGTACEPCPDGHIVSANLTQCEPLQACTGAPCDAKVFAGSWCAEPCSVGQFGPLMNYSCPPRNLDPVLPATVTPQTRTCDVCPPGSEPSRPFRAACEPCNATAASPNGIACNICSDATMPTADRAHCTPCDAISAGVGGACWPCQDGRVPNSARTQCACGYGTYMMKDGTCRICPTAVDGISAICLGAKSPARAPAGYWLQDVTLTPCWHPDTCTENNTCASTFTGAHCTICSPHTWRNAWPIAPFCVQCEPNQVFPIGFSVIGAIFPFIGALLIQLPQPTKPSVAFVLMSHVAHLAVVVPTEFWTLHPVSGESVPYVACADSVHRVSVLMLWPFAVLVLGSWWWRAFPELVARVVWLYWPMQLAVAVHERTDAIVAATSGGAFVPSLIVLICYVVFLRYSHFVHTVSCKLAFPTIEQHVRQTKFQSRSRLFNFTDVHGEQFYSQHCYELWVGMRTCIIVVVNEFGPYSLANACCSVLYLVHFMYLLKVRPYISHRANVVDALLVLFWGAASLAASIIPLRSPIGPFWVPPDPRSPLPNALPVAASIGVLWMCALLYAVRLRMLRATKNEEAYYDRRSSVIGSKYASTRVRSFDEEDESRHMMFSKLKVAMFGNNNNRASDYATKVAPSRQTFARRNEVEERIQPEEHLFVERADWTPWDKALELQLRR